MHEESENASEAARRLYGAIIKLIMDSPDAEYSSDALTALTHALVEVARASGVSPAVVIQNVTRVVGGVVVSMTPVAKGGDA